MQPSAASFLAFCCNSNGCQMLSFSLKLRARMPQVRLPMVPSRELALILELPLQSLHLVMEIHELVGPALRLLTAALRYMPGFG